MTDESKDMNKISKTENQKMLNESGKKDVSVNWDKSFKKNEDNEGDNSDISKIELEDNEELDIEELLKKKIKLDDGSEHFIFSRGPKYSDESWPINCHLCRMGNLITEEQIKFHIKGKRHLIRLEKRKPKAKLFSEPFFQCAPKEAKNETDKQIKIYPGEVISERSYQRTLGHDFLSNMSQSSASRYIGKVIDAIEIIMLEEYIRFPQTQDEIRSTKLRFFEKFGFPGVVGAIDCTHVKILAPAKEIERVYLNRHGYHSKNVQIVCDADLKILNVNAKFGGSSHDAYIYRCSKVSSFLEQNYRRGDRNTYLLVTPEYEDRIIKPEEFEVKLPTDSQLVKKLNKEPIHDYNEKLPIIGLCYMYKMNGYRGLTYYCTLCSTRISGNAFRHVTGEPHQIKYITRHFPKLYDKVVDRLSKVRGIDVKYNVRNVFRKLYRKIENAKGFRKIAIVDDDDFFKNLKKYALKTRFDTHFEESTIPITDHEVDVLIRKCINGMEFIRPDSLPDKNDKRSGGGSSTGGKDNSRNSNRGRSPPSKRKFIGVDDYGYDWERYHDLLQREIETLNIEYQEYDRYPASHSRYNIEENTFFNARKRQGHKKEVIRRDWQRIWRQRLRQMYDKDLDKRKLKVKRLLRLPLDVRTPSSSPPRMHRSSDATYNYDSRMYAGRSDGPRDAEALQPLPVSSGPLGVISCLRLLTALEDQLGSLGPKAVQLLSRAVLTEKGGKNPNDLMMENDYYIFFVTAKEKLKGQLFANIIDSTKAGVVTRAVQDCSTLLEMFEDYMRRQGKPIPGFETTKDIPPLTQYAPLNNQYDCNNGPGNFNSSGTGDSHFNSDLNTSSGSYGNNNYSTNSGLGNSSAYNSSLGASTSGGRGVGGNGQYRGNQGGAGVWQSDSYGGGGNNDNQMFPPVISYPERNSMRNFSNSYNMNKW